MPTFISESSMPMAEGLVFPPIEPLGLPGSTFLHTEFEKEFHSEYPDFVSDLLLTPKPSLIDKILLSLQ